MAGQYAGPVPTKLVALSQLNRLPGGAKVRFLGWYKPSAAELTVEHNFPSGNRRKAVVDVKLLTNILTYTDTRVGEWVNITGYVQGSTADSIDGQPTYIQALLLWSAGSVNVEEYEKTLSEMTITS